MRHNTHDGEVVSVDESTFTCVVKIGDVEYHDVCLAVLQNEQASIVSFPEVGTDVIISFREFNQSRPQILAINKIQKTIVSIGESTLTVTDGKWEFNKGELGGIPILEKINDNLDSIKSYCEKMNAAIPPAFTAVGAGGAANGATGATSYSSAMTGAAITFVDMENTKITQ